ncbi:hypothetical protein ABLX97_004619 [Salmonella enterica]|uniref:hypothetical protein n=1 Tax=Salmonella enterica TaxID=28901 RepID=UPI0009AF44F9|nr:hypothetical protein [Salmonella enterica]EDO2903775.1 hypothetical protein [Salmonella enterica]EFS8829339.1 hypothetical protein [Salmonella enterica]EFV0796828.1 hypothetical protein [Salmonella enterica]EHD7668491.1 hypothetical protein [Salmonella enterica]EJY7193826.1 hypothetical protein [Salmonella enterica]
MTTEKKNEKAAGAATPKKEPVPTLIYIGPTIPQISLLKHRIYRNGLSVECEKLISIIPGAKQLFVTTADFADAEKRLTDKTSVEAVMYSRVFAAMKEIN